MITPTPQACKKILDQLEHDNNMLFIEMEDIKKRMSAIKAKKQHYKQLLHNLNKKKGDVIISDHAVLRYLERVKGIDIEAVKKEMLTDGLLHLINVLGGTGQYPNQHLTYVFKNYNLITVYSKD